MKEAIRSTVLEILPELVELRHELHQHPEIRFEEYWTSDRIAQFLDTLGIPYTRGHAKGTGIVATLQGEGSRTVALRADIDALEIEEQTGLPYSSKIPQRMHACGHDGHTTCLCGVAKTLVKHRDAVRGKVKFIFQPGEEQAAGGRFIVQEGHLDDVDGVFALHGWPTLPVGSIGLRAGYLLASASNFYMEITGKGCHAADPASGVDSVLVAAHITAALQSIVSREIDPLDCAVVTVAQIQAGTATNVIPQTAQLAGTIRSFRPEVHRQLEESVKRIAKDVAHAFRATAEVNFGDEPYPALYNHEAETEFVRRTAHDVLGEARVVEMEKPFMGAEDFAYYLQRAPGSFLCLGVNPSATDPYPALHNPRYDFSDTAIPTAVELMSQIAIRFLSQP